MPCIPNGLGKEPELAPARLPPAPHHAVPTARIVLNSPSPAPFSPFTKRAPCLLGIGWVCFSQFLGSRGAGPKAIQIPHHVQGGQTLRLGGRPPSGMDAFRPPNSGKAGGTRGEICRRGNDLVRQGRLFAISRRVRPSLREDRCDAGAAPIESAARIPDFPSAPCPVNSAAGGVPLRPIRKE